MLARIKTGIYSCNKSLSCRFLVAARSIYLARIKKAGNAFCFECREQLCRFDIIVFNCIARTAHDTFFKTWYRAKELILHFLWKRR